MYYHVGYKCKEIKCFDKKSTRIITTQAHNQCENDSLVSRFIVTILQCIWFSNFIRQSSVQLKLYGKMVAISIFNYEIKTTSFPSKCFLIATTADCNLWITVYTLRYMIYIKTSDHVSV